MPGAASTPAQRPAKPRRSCSFIFLAARFSFSDLPGFFGLALRGDLSLPLPAVIAFLDSRRPDPSVGGLRRAGCLGDHPIAWAGASPDPVVHPVVSVARFGVAAARMRSNAAALPFR